MTETSICADRRDEMRDLSDDEMLTISGGLNVRLVPATVSRITYTTGAESPTPGLVLEDVTSG